MGRKISTLVHETQEPGIYTIHFEGFQLSRGVYFYRLRPGSTVDVKRIVLLK